MTFGERLVESRKKAGYNQKQFAEALDITPTRLNYWEKDKRQPDVEMIEKISRTLGVSADFLIGNTVREPRIPAYALPLPKTKKSPIRGDIACGEPMLAIDEVSDYADIDESIPSDFSLRCHGDSMIGIHIIDGDLVHIKSQRDVENGQVAAVEIDGEATLKRIRKIYNQANRLVSIELIAENPTFPVRRYDGEEMSAIRIDGLLVGVTRKVRQ